MKDILISFLFMFLMLFAVCTVCGAVAAMVDIIRNPERYKMNNSVDIIPEDYLDHNEKHEEVVENKFTFSQD